MRWILEALDATGEWQGRELQVGALLRVRPALGSTGVALRCRPEPGVEGVSGFVLEVPCGSEEPVLFEVGAGASADPAPILRSTGRSQLRLPVETPISRPCRPEDGDSLDLALLIDATLLCAVPGDEPVAAPELRPLLAEPEARARAFELWRAWIEAWVGPEDRFAVLAFGDHEPPFPVAGDLRPAFLHDPEPERVEFVRPGSGLLERRLAALRASSGGDAVDGVAEGLSACLDLPWRTGACRRVLLVGGSPGYSIIHPGPAGSAAFPRRLDVDTTALKLRQEGIELATVWWEEEEGLIPGTLGELQRFGREQYARLASCPDLVFEHRGSRPLEPVHLRASIKRSEEISSWQGHGTVAGFWEDPT